jgi:hypothetical protein
MANIRLLEVAGAASPPPRHNHDFFVPVQLLAIVNLPLLAVAVAIQSEQNRGYPRE